MAIYQVKAFTRFARQHRISRQALAVAATDVRDGRFDADLGGGLYKQRVARQGSGKSGGFRTLNTCPMRGGSPISFINAPTTSPT